MPFPESVDPYVDIESYVTVRECAELLNISQDKVIELAKQGTLRSRGSLVQPALIQGYTT
jgi:hypothetical protein